MNPRLQLSLCLAIVVIAWGYYTIKNHETYLWSLKPYPGFATAAEVREESPWLETGIERIVIKYQPWLVALFVSMIAGILGANFTRWHVYILLCIGFVLSPLVAWTVWMIVPLLVPLILLAVLLIVSVRQMRPSELILTCYLAIHYSLCIVIGLFYFSDIWDTIIGD